MDAFICLPPSEHCGASADPDSHKAGPASVVSNMSLEEYLQHASSLCRHDRASIKALNALEKEQFRVANLKQVQM